jgi:TRAP-type mannitol/chloroaromatic compound transport system permease small subunit
MTAAADSGGMGRGMGRGQPPAVVLSRAFAWATIAAMTAFLVNNYLTNWRDWPGPTSVFTGGGALAWVQVAVYLLCLAAALGYVFGAPGRALRPDAAIIYRISAYVVRAAFWAVFLIGLADTVVSFLRVEGMLPGLVGDAMTTDLGRSQFRGVWVHFPMVAVALVIAAVTRGFGFHWLALLVVGAEMLIVLSRFIFSYEQAFMGDLVRFWYAALFLFASAHTLLEEGHVRVDVLYSLFSDRAKGISNALGTAFLGMPLCWTVILLGMESKSTVINSPLLAFEVTQTGFGMYVKYWMAGFLAIFAVTMLLQFSGYFLEAIADVRGEPGKRETRAGVGVAAAD